MLILDTGSITTCATLVLLFFFFFFFFKQILITSLDFPIHFFSNFLNVKHHSSIIPYYD